MNWDSFFNYRVGIKLGKLRLTPQITLRIVQAELAIIIRVLIGFLETAYRIIELVLLIQQQHKSLDELSPQI